MRPERSCDSCRPLARALMIDLKTEEKKKEEEEEEKER
jgi:hypothetical protein